MKRLIIKDGMLVTEGITVEEFKAMHEAWEATLASGIIWMNGPIVFEGDFSELFKGRDEKKGLETMWQFFRVLWAIVWKDLQEVIIVVIGTFAAILAVAVMTAIWHFTVWPVVCRFFGGTKYDWFRSIGGFMVVLCCGGLLWAFGAWLRKVIKEALETSEG